MAGVSSEEAVAQLLAVLREAFEGAEKWSYFTDHGAESALLGTLAKLNAEAASRPVAGTSVAAHTHHIVFSLAASAAWIRGDRSQRDWSESWRVQHVDEAGWAALQKQVRDGYADLSKIIEAHAAASVETIGGAIGVVAHVAYHLGAIRQKVAMAQRG